MCWVELHRSTSPEGIGTPNRAALLCDDIITVKRVVMFFFGVEPRPYVVKTNRTLGSSDCYCVIICTQLGGSCCRACRGLPPPHLLFLESPCQSIFSYRRNRGLVNLLLCKCVRTDTVFITALGQPTSQNNWSSLLNSSKPRTRILRACVLLSVTHSPSACLTLALPTQTELCNGFVLAHHLTFDPASASPCSSLPPINLFFCY